MVQRQRGSNQLDKFEKWALGMWLYACVLNIIIIIIIPGAYLDSGERGGLVTSNATIKQ